ncbi:MAG: hypothetical protein K1W20_07875, partial [Lachnospiraceae bacterium]
NIYSPQELSDQEREYLEEPQSQIRMPQDAEGEGELDEEGNPISAGEGEEGDSGEGGSEDEKEGEEEEPEPNEAWKDFPAPPATV